MKLDPDKCYAIEKVNVHIEGRRVVEEPFWKNVREKLNIEERYVIRRCDNEFSVLSEEFYTHACRDECARASNSLRRTRKYKNPIDSEYFRYYDDALEVKENIVAFVEWLIKKSPGLPQREFKKVMTRNETKMMYRHVKNQKWWNKVILNDGSDVKMRKELPELERELADERDLAMLTSRLERVS